jgi:hypothetical protein
MAVRNLYVSDATGDDADSGLTEALAKKTLAGALAIAIAGDFIWVKADGTYEFTSAAVVADDDVTIVGYLTTPHATDPYLSDLGYNNPTNYKNTRVIFNNDGGSHATISVNDGIDSLSVLNIKFTGCDPTDAVAFPIDYTNFTSVQLGHTLHNCWFDGGVGLNCHYLSGPLILDCKFTGDWWFVSGTSIPFEGAIHYLTSGLVMNNFFKVEGGDGCLNNVGDPGTPSINYRPTICHNIFTSTAVNLYKELVRLQHPATFFNNVLYQPEGAVYGVGTTSGPFSIGEDALMKLHIGSKLIVSCFNNIFISDRATGIPEGMWVDAVGGDDWSALQDFNCFYNVTMNKHTARPNDLLVDPQLVDPDNDDFRLKPTSPLLNYAYPRIGGGSVNYDQRISGGSWQRKSLIRSL